jgi:hypothetical protein
MLQTEITNHAKKLFTEELTKLNFNQMHLVDVIVENYVGSLYEAGYVEEEGTNILNFMDDHFKYWAEQFSKMDWEEIVEERKKRLDEEY